MRTPIWQPLDEQISRWMHSHATPTLDQAMITITSGGNLLALLTATIAFTLILWWRHQQRRRAAMVYALAALTSYVLNGALKHLFERPRPQLWQQLISLPGDPSFPSGHAMISMTVYGLAAWFLAEHFPAWRRVILLATGLLILLIGTSRVYLGVHWASDVLAGFLCGFVILAASGRWHQRQRLHAQTN